MISLASLFLISIALTGVLILGKTINEKRLFTLVPSGMVWGVCLYIFMLNLTSKIWPGKSGIIVSTLILYICGLAVLYTHIKSFKLRLTSANLTTIIVISGLILTTIYFARLKMTSVLPVADSNMQWAYAASFARGNYPIKTPWQPDLNPAYHLGAYFLEGAMLSIFNLPLITIHSLLNTYYLIAGSLFAIFIFWENKYSFKNIWLIIATLVLYISFGVIMLILPSADFFKNITTYPKTILETFTRFPDNIFAKGEAGAALTNLNLLSYLPARSLSIGIAFLALYFSMANFKNPNIKILFFVLVFATSALVEESMFLPLYLVTLVLIFTSSQKVMILKILSLSLLVIILQGGFFQDFLNKNQSAFKINVPFLDPPFTSQLQKIMDFSITSTSKQIIWFIPGPFWMTLIILIYSYCSKNDPLRLITLFSFASMISFLLIEYRYSPSTNVRFFSFANISAGCGIFYMLFMILKDKSLRLNIVLLIASTFFVLTPTLLPEILNQFSQINQARLKGIRSQVLIESEAQSPFERISSWANKNLPENARLVSLDTHQPNPYRSLQFQYKGLYTILGSQYIHTNRPEPGPEFFDLILTLNPNLLKKTKVEYIYIESKSLTYKQLPEFRKDDLANGNFFQLLKSIEEKEQEQEIFYRLYKVLPEFFDEKNGGRQIRQGTLDSLQVLIPDGKSVYVADYGDGPNLSFWYRMALILALKEKDLRRNLSQTDYQIIETYLPYKSDNKVGEYDYYILGSFDKPPIPAKQIWSNIYAGAWQRI